MGYFCPKNTFLQVKHYVQSVYLIFPVIFVIFHDNSSVFLSSKIRYFLQKQPIKVGIFRLSTAWVIVHQIPHVIFQTKVSFSSKFGSFFSVMRDNSSVLLQLKLAVAHQSANFQTCHCSHLNSPNSSFWNQESVFLQTLHQSSVS